MGRGATGAPTIIAMLATKYGEQRQPEKLSTIILIANINGKARY